MKTLPELIEEEYLEHKLTDDEDVYYLKEALKNGLNKIERKIFLTYLESGTYAKTAKVFKVSVPTISKYINNLKNKIMEYVDDNNKSADD